MEDQGKLRRAVGWQDDETERLFSAVRTASAEGRPLRTVFETLSEDLGRKPNSIRNYYYACLREHPDVQPRQEPIRAFTPEETHELLRSVLIARGQGHSVRSCVMRMADGDRRAMLRYQNKYRTLLKTRPDLLEAVRQELMDEGLPCPNRPGEPEHVDAAFCDPGDPAAARLMAQPCVADMLEGIKELLRRAARAENADEHLRTLDRLRVEQDLRRMAWQREFDEAIGHLNMLLAPLRELAADPAAAPVIAPLLPAVSSAEAFLTRAAQPVQ